MFMRGEGRFSLVHCLLMKRVHALMTFWDDCVTALITVEIRSCSLSTSATTRSRCHANQSSSSRLTSAPPLSKPGMAVMRSISACLAAATSSAYKSALF